jgi:hypothetical protein
MKMAFDWRYAVMGLATCVVVSLVAVRLMDLEFWPVLAMTFAAVLANGLIASRR